MPGGRRAYRFLMLSASRNQMRFTATVLVILSFLILGMLLGRTAGHQWGSIVAPTPALGKREYLVLGYDALEPPAQLLAVWRITLEGKGEARLYGISPATILFLPDGQPAILRDLLRDPANPNLKPLERFLSLQPEAVILLDSRAFATLANRLGGVFLEGRSLKGQEVVDTLRGLQATPVDALEFQAQTLRALAQRVPPRPEEFIFAGLAPLDLRSSVPVEQLIADNEARFPYLSNRISIDTLDDVSGFSLPDGSEGLLPLAAPTPSP